MDDNKRIELEALITEREGMIAGNLQAQMQQWQYPMYYEYQFLDVANRMRVLKEE